MDCGAVYTSDCNDVWGQVKGLLSSARPHQNPVTPAQTCGQFTHNGRLTPWCVPVCLFLPRNDFGVCVCVCVFVCLITCKMHKSHTCIHSCAFMCRVSTHVENLLQHYCWHTEKIAAIDEDGDTFFGRSVMFLTASNTNFLKSMYL